VEAGWDFVTTESEKFSVENKLAAHDPDIFVVALCEYARFSDVARVFVEKKHREGMAVMMMLDYESLTQHSRGKAVFAENPSYIYWGYYPPDLIPSFAERYGVPYHWIPLAANHVYHTPGEYRAAYAADIAFLGARLPTKESLFRKVLFPLAKKYRVRILGPRWTARDNFLRVLSGVGRKLRWFPLADWANDRRIRIPPSEERHFYASAKICVNIHEYDSRGLSKNMSNEREFKIPACGGFQMSDDVAGLRKLFISDEEIVIPRSVDEWFEKVAFYLAHEPERKRIQEQGTARAHRDHYYRNRVKMMLRLAGYPEGAA
jgi:spore maturation protein CgeB